MKKHREPVQHGWKPPPGWLEYYGLRPAKRADAAVAAELAARAGADPGQVTLEQGGARLGGGRRGELEAQGSGGFAVRVAAEVESPGELEAVLGHELVHVAQHQLPPEVPAAPRELLEEEAHRLGERVAAGERVRPVHRADAGASRVLGFESFEHKALIEQGARTEDGRARTIRLKASGIEVTAGEVGALMKDFFSEWAYLDGCPRERLWPLVQLIRRQSEQAARNGGRPTAGEAAANDREAQRLTAWREEEVYDPAMGSVRKRGELEGGETESYVTLATKNNDHFYEANLKWSMKQIGAALTLLVRGASRPEAERAELERQAEGLVYASFHGLTDALSTGHMTLGKQMRDAGRQFWHEHRAEILAHLMKALQAHSFLTGYLTSHPAGQAALPRLLASLLEEKIESLFLKLDHDRLNREGLWLRNGRGQAWLAFGDDHLAQSFGTQVVGAGLVTVVLEHFDRFKAELRAGKMPTAQAYDDIQKDVSALLPSHVERGGEMIPIADFAKNETRFLASLREQLMTDDPQKNRLCQLVVGNLGLAGQQLEQGISAGLSHVEADGDQAYDQDPIAKASKTMGKF